MQILLENCQDNQEKWFEMKQGKVGASLAYDAADIDDFADPVKAWLTLRGERPEIEDNESMYFGRQLEDFTAEEFARRYVTDHPGAEVKLTKADCLVQHPSIPWAVATPDYWVDINGERCLLNPKTTKAQFLDSWEEGQCPNRYRAQMLHELACCPGIFRAFLGCFIFAPTYRYVEIERQEAFIQTLLEREASTYDYFLKKTPPPLKIASPESLRAHFWEAKGDVLLPEDAQGEVLAKLCKQYADWNEKAKAAEAEKKLLSTAVLEQCGSFKKARVPGFNVTMVRSEYNDLDSKRIREEDPILFNELFAKYGKAVKKFYPLIKAANATKDSD